MNITSLGTSENISASVSNENDSHNAQGLGDSLAFFNNQLFPLWSDNSNSTGNNPNGFFRGLDAYINGVLVSDFYTPNYFDTSDREGVRYDLLGHIQKPLGGKKSIAIPTKRRPSSGKSLIVRGARQYNLRNIDVTIPLEQFNSSKRDRLSKRDRCAFSGNETTVCALLYSGCRGNCLPFRF